MLISREKIAGKKVFFVLLSNNAAVYSGIARYHTDRPWDGFKFVGQDPNGVARLKSSVLEPIYVFIGLDLNGDLIFIWN